MPFITLQKPQFQGRTGQCGNAAIAARFFFKNASFFFKCMRGILKEILRDIETFSK
jgi:hypothetical protein